MMPGITYLPVASIVTAPAGALSPLPIRAILPFSSSRSVLVSVPFVTVRMVAFLMSVGGTALFAGAACCAAAGTASTARSAASDRVVFIVCLATSVGVGTGESSGLVVFDGDRAVQSSLVDGSVELRFERFAADGDRCGEVEAAVAIHLTLGGTSAELPARLPLDHAVQTVAVLAQFECHRAIRVRPRTR